MVAYNKEEEIIEENPITCCIIDRLVAGSCNACHDMETYTVIEIEIEIKGYSFRLCNDCAKNLKKQLTEILK